MSTKKQKKYDSHFQDEWLADPKYSFWLKKYPQDSSKGDCLVCLKTVSGSATNQETAATNLVNTLDKPTSPQSSIKFRYQRGSD